MAWISRPASSRKCAGRSAAGPAKRTASHWRRKAANFSATARDTPRLRRNRWTSAGVGSSAHLCAELFKRLTGLPDIVHVPYKGAGPGLGDFYAGHLPMFAASISPQVLDMHRQGKIRIRHPKIDVPSPDYPAISMF